MPTFGIKALICAYINEPGKAWIIKMFANHTVLKNKKENFGKNLIWTLFCTNFLTG